MDSSKKIKKDKEADYGGAGAPGDRCGGDGDKPPSKKIKTEDRDDGGDDDDDDEDNGEGGGGSGGNGNPHIRVGGANAPPLSDLVLVGKYSTIQHLNTKPLVEVE
mmetsp:Transcript_24351/g.39575  ORF Transcript_24351/g.39575 Transcript_24351/m.39575 type:complete len:105 (-) Transcript_24351:268-582(-)